MAKVVANLTVKMPKWRMRAVRLAVYVIAPFVRTPEAGERVMNAMSDWVGRGLRVYADGKRVG